jgi:hypothetical protein
VEEELLDLLARIQSLYGVSTVLRLPINSSRPCKSKVIPKCERGKEAIPLGCDLPKKMTN